MIGEMMPYVRDRRKQPEDLHDQYKKWEEQELPVVVEFEQRYCNRPLLLSSRLQPEEVRPAVPCLVLYMFVSQNVHHFV